MRRLILGGSFNPIHHGHLICSRAVAQTLGYDRLTLIPNAQPPHKVESATLAAAADRLGMIRHAVAGDAYFTVDEIEQNLPAPSFTIDTARALTARGDGPVHWLIGADMLLYLPKWHQSDHLLREVHFIIMARPGWSIDWNALPPEYRHLEKNVVQAPLIDISASDIRARVAAGKSIKYLTPEGVCRYIEERGLYRA